MLVFPGKALDVNTRSVNFSKSRTLLSVKHRDPTVPELTGWSTTSDETGTLCPMSSTLALEATEELTRTPVPELEPP